MTDTVPEAVPLTLTDEQLRQLADAIAKVLSGYLAPRPQAQVLVDDPVNEIGDGALAGQTPAAEPATLPEAPAPAASASPSSPTTSTTAAADVFGFTGANATEESR